MTDKYCIDFAISACFTQRFMSNDLRQCFPDLYVFYYSAKLGSLSQYSWFKNPANRIHDQNLFNICLSHVTFVSTCSRGPVIKNKAVALTKGTDSTPYIPYCQSSASLYNGWRHTGQVRLWNKNSE